MYFSYRLKFFIILHFFIKLNLTLYATSICLLRVLLNLRFDQKDKKCREKTVPDYLSIFNNITTMMVGRCRTGRSSHIKGFKLGTIEPSKEPGCNVTIKQLMAINIRKCKFGNEFKLQIFYVLLV